MAFFSVPNGMHMPDWQPKSEGKLDELPAILAPLEPLKSSLTVLSGLTLDGGRAKYDGPGDHARSAASFLTGAHPKKTDGKDIHNGISVDQVAAEKIGYQTRFASLELGCERGAQAGNCDSGYSCAYSSNISWRTPTSALAHEVNPRAVFDRLFGPVNESADERSARATRSSPQEHSGFCGRGRRRPAAQLDLSDGRKLDEYLYAVREIERRLQKTEVKPVSVSAARGQANRPANLRNAPVF